jgi:ATP-dependent RNA helicase DDX42
MPGEELKLNEFERMEQEILNDDGEIDFDKLRQLEKKGIQPLPPVDHSQIEYESFEKEFYKEHPEITNMPADVINAQR